MKIIVVDQSAKAAPAPAENTPTTSVTSTTGGNRIIPAMNPVAESTSEPVEVTKMVRTQKNVRTNYANAQSSCMTLCGRERPCGNRYCSNYKASNRK